MKLTSTRELCLFAVFLFTACGTPGPPLPPSLELARPITDLKANRKGNKIYLTWSTPTQTTDKYNIKQSGIIEVCSSIGSPLRECGIPLAKLSFEKPSETQNRQKMQTSYTVELAPALQSQNPTVSVFYAINILNSYGRSAGLSNQVQLPAAPTVPPPNNFRAQLKA